MLLAFVLMPGKRFPIGSFLKPASINPLVSEIPKFDEILIVLE